MFAAAYCFVCLCTFDRRIVAILLAVAVLLSICVLLCVLQTQFMTNLKRLANRPHNTHCLALGELGGEKKNSCVKTLYEPFFVALISSLIFSWIYTNTRFLPRCFLLPYTNPIIFLPTPFKLTVKGKFTPRNLTLTPNDNFLT